MAEQIASEEGLCINEFDLSGISSNFGFARTLEIKEKVCFPGPTQGTGSFPTKSRGIGPESMKIDNAGYLDPAINLAAAEAALAAGPAITKLTSRAIGSRVYMFEGAQSSFDYGSQVGEWIAFTLSASNHGPVHPGLLYSYGIISASGNSASQTTTAIAANSGKTRCLHAHAITLTGTATLALIYETSALGDYTDAVTRHTFSVITAPTPDYERAIKTAAVSDTNGRFKWTITGTGTFMVRFAEGVK